MIVAFSECAASANKSLRLRCRAERNRMREEKENGQGTEWYPDLLDVVLHACMPLSARSCRIGLLLPLSIHVYIIVCHIEQAARKTRNKSALFFGSFVLSLVAKKKMEKK